MNEYIDTIIKEMKYQNFIKDEDTELFEILIAGILEQGEKNIKENKLKRIENFLENKKFEQNFDCTETLSGMIKGLEIAIAILKDDK